MRLRTLIYARVSTEDQAEKYGLPSQLRACREYAAAHGLEIIEEICDEGISGAILERPGLERLRQRVRDGEVDVVLILDPDRLSRELIHLLILKPEIEKRARLEFVTTNFDKTPSGELFFNLKGAIAKYERAVTRDRCMRGQKERARAGQIHGGRVAYGYRRENGRLAIDEERAVWLRLIFAWYEAGVSMRAITLRLRAAGAPTWPGRTKSVRKEWSKSSVRRILGNETYAGVAYFGTHRSDGGKTVLRVPQERIALIVPALIDRAQWDRVQARIAQNPCTGRPSTTFMLRGLLHCAACGRRMHGDKGTRGWSEYRCQGRDPQRLSAPAEACYARIGSRKLDAAAWREIVTMTTDAGFLQALLSEREGALRNGRPERIAELAAQARKAKAREDLALQLMLDPELVEDRASIRQRHLEAQRERKRVEAEIAAAERESRAGVSAREWIADTVKLLQGYIPTLTTQAQRQEFVRGMISRADWDGEELKMRCFIGPKAGTTACRYAQFEALEVLLTARLAA